MLFSEIAEIQKNVVLEIIKNPNKGYEYFKTEWINLEPEEKKWLGPLLQKFCDDKLAEREYFPTQHEIITEIQICCNAVKNFISDEFNGKPWFGNLEKGDNINEDDIAAVFKLLLDLGYIKSTLDKTARVLTRVFGFKQDFERYSYFNDDDKIRVAAIEFKEKVVNSRLIRGSNS